MDRRAIRPRLARALAGALVVLGAVPAPARAGASEALLWLGGAYSSAIGGDGELLGDGGRNGVTAGMSLLWKLGDHVGVELGGRYTQKGAKGTISSDFTEADSTGAFVFDGTLRLDYVEVPLLVAGVLPAGQKSEVRAYAGVSANFLVTSQLTGRLNGAAYDRVVENVTSLEWSATVGVSYEYRMNTAAVIFDLRFVGGLQSIEDSPDLDADVRLRSFQFAVGLGIPLGAGHF